MIQLLLAERGTAIHLDEGEPPVLEIREELHRIEGPPLENHETEFMLRSIAPAPILGEVRRGCTGFTHEYFGSEFHVMAFREAGTIRLELRRRD